MPHEVPPRGLEPLACCLGGSRSIHLSYGGEANNLARPFDENNAPASDRTHIVRTGHRPDTAVE
jgi:hypothetical protein